MVKVRIDLVRDDGLAAAPEEPAPVRAADEVEAPEALKKRGDAAFRRGEAAAAARLWTRAAAVARDDRRLAVACLANMARAQLDLGRAADALRAAAEALSLDPDHARARYFRARALLALGRRAEADEEIACLVAREPDNPRVLELKAEAARVPEAAPAEVDGASVRTAAKELVPRADGDAARVPRDHGDAARSKAAAPVARAGVPPAPANAPTDPAARARAAARPAFATTWTAMAAREAASSSDEPRGGEAYAPPASRFNVDAPKAPPPAARADPAAAEVARLRARRPDPEPSTDGAPRSVHAILAEKRKARRAARAAPAPASAAPATAWTAMVQAEAADVATARTRRPAGAPPKSDRRDRGPSVVEPMIAGPQVAEAWMSLETDESAKQAIAACRNDAGATEGDATARRKARQVLQEARARKKSGVVRAPVADEMLAAMEDEHRERLEEYRRRKEALEATRAALSTKKGGSKV